MENARVRFLFTSTNSTNGAMKSVKSSLKISQQQVNKSAQSS